MTDKDEAQTSHATNHDLPVIEISGMPIEAAEGSPTT
jgi:hypothetical protein